MFFEPQSVYRGPSVAAIGWIPSRGICQKIPPAFHQHRRWWGLKPLFATGNPRPPDSFDGEEGFRDFLKAKEYRAVLCVTGVEAGFAFGKTQRDLPHDHIMKGGYTPLGLATDGQELGIRYRYYSPGIDRAMSSIAIGSECAPIGKTIGFRIGKFGNWMSKILVGHFAPFASIGVGYEIFHDGNYKITFAGTYVPTQKFYVNWQAVHSYSMENISVEHLEDFLTAETRGEGPLSTEHYVHSGKLTAE